MGSRQTGVRVASKFEIRRISVTLATLPQSILYTRILRDATLLPGGTVSVFDLGGPGGSKKEEVSNRPATGLQLACNLPATMAALRHGYGVAPLLLKGHERVSPAERQRFCAVGAPPDVVVPARHARSEWLVVECKDAGILARG